MIDRVRGEVSQRGSQTRSGSNVAELRFEEIPHLFLSMREGLERLGELLMSVGEAHRGRRIGLSVA